MNLAAAISRFVLRWPARPFDTNRARGAISTMPRRPAARGTLAWFGITVLAIHFAAYFIIDVSGEPIRDPEYGDRVISLKKKLAQNPGRPLVVVIGSSRCSMGIRPQAWEEERPNEPGRPDPLIFNMSLVGSGPLMELMCLRRLYMDGIEPDAVILEYWPAFLREDGPYYEPDRIDHARLSDRDRRLVREYFDHPDDIERKMLHDRLSPLFENRHRLMAQMLPRWQPWDKRMEMSWANLDDWGWLSGLEENYPPDPKMRKIRLDHCEKVYVPQFQNFGIHEIANRSLRESVALARSHGAKVAFVYMPEATEFRTWIPESVESMAREHLAGLRRELGISMIDARDWMPDGYMVDGFHLSRIGATKFTQRFGPAVTATFPDLGSGR